MTHNAAHGEPAPPSEPPGPQQPAAPAGAAPPPPPRRRSAARRIVLGVLILLFVVSVAMNGYLLLLLSLYLDRGFAETVIRDGDDHQVIAVYAVSGVIDDQAAATFDALYRSVRDDPDVRAVVLRVDSPGGTVSASDRLHARVKDLRRRGKTVVVSMGGVAASGGYYVSAPADEIVAEPTTVTGSIGVIAMWPVFRGTMDKLGIEPVVMKSTHARGWKDQISVLKRPDARQRADLQAGLNAMQARFEQVVTDGRGLRGEGGKLLLEEKTYRFELADGNEVVHHETVPFNGKTYLAGEAKRLGLIDEIGYRSKAVERAQALAGLSDPKVVVYRKRLGLLDVLARFAGGAAGGARGVDLEALWRPRTPRIMVLWQAQ
jgi:protease-4